MKAGGVLVERVSEVTDELVEVMARLLPQLSSSALPPDRAALEEIVASPTSSLFVARLASRDDVIVGAITLLIYRIPTGLHAVIEDVVVDESARGHGVGSALVSEAVNLTSRASREAANRLYQRAGFVIRETNVYRLNLS
jgi:ribosomal protein S18 acetylase RimI-like enzyme